MTDKTLLVLNGPGLAELGDHDGNTYGNLTLDLIRDECTLLCEQLGVKLDFRQTDDEEEMFRFIAKDSEDFDALIINPVGYSRAASVEFEMYRMAIKTIAHLKKPVIEVHLENIFQEVLKLPSLYKLLRVRWVLYVGLVSTATYLLLKQLCEG